MNRIQRKRTKGWKMPKNTIYVGRPTKWGNPFELQGDMIYCDASHRRLYLSKWILWEDKLYNKTDGLKRICELYEQWINNDLPEWNYQNHHIVKPFNNFDLNELKGKNLACWCPLDKPCHADILIKLLNNTCF